MKLIQQNFQLKEDKMETPNTFLGTTLTQMDNIDGYQCWVMSSD